MTDWKQLRAEVLQVFTPGPPISELERFAGRKNIIQRLQDIANEKARHAIIFGERGVGKTSLAAVFHKDLNIIDKNSGINTKKIRDIHINADSKDSYDSLWRKVFRRIERDGATNSIDLEYTGPIEPDHVFIELQKFDMNTDPIIIIDEYDRIGDEDCRILMTDTIKALSLCRNNPTIILVGVADNIIHLVQDHESISRNLVQIPMKRMSNEEIKEIIRARVKLLSMKISDDALWRIAHFSGGLPFYAHSLGKYAALSAIGEEKREIEEKTVVSAIDMCMADVDYSITESYVRATERIYRKDNMFRFVLAACALAETNGLGQFTAVAVEEPLSAIIGQVQKVPNFAFHLNEICGPERGSVLRKSGERKTFLYNFGEAAMQPFVIMKSLKDEIITRDIFEKFYVTRQMRLPL